MALSGLVLILALALDDTVDAHLGRGYDALRQDRFAEAVTEFRAALEVDPKLVMRARFPLAVSLFQMKSTAESRQEFEAVRRTMGEQPGTSYYLGRLDLLDQNFPSAIRNLNRAMDSPPFPDTAYHLGFACLKQGDLVMAEKWLKVAARTNPADGAVPFQLAAVYRKQGREEEAKKALALSADLRRRDTDESQLRQECGQKLDHAPRDEARTFCNQLFDPNNAEKLTALGTIYGQHGDLEAAVEPLRRAAELMPQSPQMQYNLGYTYNKLNRFEEARAALVKAAEHWPDVFQLQFLYGVVLLNLGRPVDAWPVLKHAHELNQRDAQVSEILYRTSMTLARSSDRATAKRYYEQAAKIRPGDAEAARGK